MTFKNINCWLRNRKIFKDFSEVIYVSIWATIFWQNVENESQIILNCPLPPHPWPHRCPLNHLCFSRWHIARVFDSSFVKLRVSKYLKDYQSLIMRLILVHFNLKSKYMSDCTFRKRKWHHEIKGLCLLASWQIWPWAGEDDTFSGASFPPRARQESTSQVSTAIC